MNLWCKTDTDNSKMEWGRGGGGPLLKTNFGVYDPNYIRSSDPKGFVPSFKTLDLVVDQSLAANLTYASEF